MGTLNATRFASIEAEITQMTESLREILSAAAAKKRKRRRALQRFVGQVERLGMAAGTASLIGLQEVCMMLREGLRELGAQEGNLTENQRELLEAWPALVAAYVTSPADPEAGEALLTHLRNSQWASPFGEEGLEVVKDWLIPQSSAPQARPKDETSDQNGATPESIGPGAGDIVPAMPDEAGAPDQAEVQGGEAASGDNAVQEGPTEQTSERREDASGPEPTEAQILFEEQASDQNEAPPEIVQPHGDDALPDVSENTNTLTPAELSRDGPPPGDASCAEIAEISEFRDDILSVAAAKKRKRRRALQRYSDQVERLGAAAGTAGLMGLEEVCRLFQGSLRVLRAQRGAITEQQSELLEAWPALVAAYVQSPSDPQVGDALINFLRDPQWVTPRSEEDLNALREAVAAESTRPKTPIQEEVSHQIETAPVSIGPDADNAAPDRHDPGDAERQVDEPSPGDLLNAEDGAGE